MGLIVPGGNVPVWLGIFTLTLNLSGDVSNGRKEHGSLGNTDLPTLLPSLLS